MLTQSTLRGFYMARKGEKLGNYTYENQNPCNFNAVVFEPMNHIAPPVQPIVICKKVLFLFVESTKFYLLRQWTNI
jgi:hypothetical protein